MYTFVYLFLGLVMHESIFLLLTANTCLYFWVHMIILWVNEWICAIMLQKWYMWKVICCPYPQCQLDISKVLYHVSYIGNTTNKQCEEKGYELQQQWWGRCSARGNFPVAAALPALPVFLAVSHMVIGFSAGLRAVGTSHHTGGLPGRLCYAPPGEGTWQGGVLWAQTMCRLHCLTQEIHYSWSLQIDEKAMCESVSVCVMLRYSLTTLNTFIILI